METNSSGTDWVTKIKSCLIEIAALASLAFVVIKVLVAEIESLGKFLDDAGIVDQFHAWFS